MNYPTTLDFDETEYPGLDPAGRFQRSYCGVMGEKVRTRRAREACRHLRVVASAAVSLTSCPLGWISAHLPFTAPR